ncbi:ATP-binding protein [Rubrivivax sp. JA1055]|uniref:sensor histidine kinase n=1 Tax=Rubrivivax sp. JA1055 TaxID=2894194 RepID=UPI001E4BDCA1|nr:ATP-binding protein [Rubrivivax sp. JA1055]MCC9596562.1 PAS domain S-box protein [Rubrivivax sp. JA1055]
MNTQAANPRRRRPRPLTARLVIGGGAALLALLLAVTGAIAAYEYGEARDVQLDRAELLARMVEEHATHEFEDAGRVLAAAADVASRVPVERHAELGTAFAQTAAGQPLVAATVLVDSRGLVLASSVPGARGRTIELARISRLPAPGQLAYGGYLADASPVLPARAAVPVLRGVLAADGRPLTLVGLLDPAELARFQRHALEDPGTSAMLVRHDGLVLSATPAAVAAAGERIAAGEDGRFTVDDLPQHVTAARTLASQPELTVLVTRDLDVALATWRRMVAWLAAGAAAAAALIAAMTFVAERSVRAREAARRQRDAAQLAVALRERELSVIVKSVQELIFRTDAEGRLTFVNARWLAATGQPGERLIGQALVDLMAPSSREAVAALLAPSASGSRAAQVSFAGTEQRLFDLAVSPLIEGGRVVGHAGSAVDVTERCAAQRELQEQLALSALMLDTMPLPVALMDREAAYVTVNRAWEQQSGMPREDLVGKRASDYLLPAEAEVHERHNREVLERGGSLSYESEVSQADGTRRTMAVTKAAVTDADGRPRGLIAALTDITEFREADRTMREARDIAEEASRAKSEFIANISHELRTPLQAIIGFSELGMVRGRAHELLASMFGDIHAAGQRMLALVNDLLDVSKIESTVGTFHLERTDLRPLVREVAREIDPLLARRRLHLDLALSDGPLVAKVDPMRFQQVVRNVLANAVRFSPDGETITVRGDVDARNQIVVAVRDHGPGIPPGELEKIFEAFVQSSKTKDGSGGTGLGLAICRKIVEAHGGSIQAENADGGGSRFTIAVPARGFADTVV